jgi:hypothetical protein
MCVATLLSRDADQRVIFVGVVKTHIGLWWHTDGQVMRDLLRRYIPVYTGLGYTVPQPLYTGVSLE